MSPVTEPKVSNNMIEESFQDKCHKKYIICTGLIEILFRYRRFRRNKGKHCEIKTAG